MKRILLIFALLGGVCFPSEAQSWGDLLKGLFGNSETSQEAPTPTPTLKHPSSRQLWGTWAYQEALIDYTGEDMLASMAVSALEGQIEGYCTKAGVVAGREKLTLSRNGTARILIKGKEAEGRYTYSPTSGAITLKITLDGKQASLQGTASLKEGSLHLYFKAEEVLAAMKSAAPELAENEHIKIASTLISNYPGIRIGVRLKR